MKNLLIQNHVPTSHFIKIIPGQELDSIQQALHHVGPWPLFIKPAVSYASLSISDTSIVRSIQEAVDQIERVRQLTDSDIYIERFLDGREFTALVTGCAGTLAGVAIESSPTSSSEDSIKVYSVAERVFNPKLKNDQRVLAFDRYWDGYDLNGGNGNGGQLYWYEKAPEEWQEHLKGMFTHFS